MTGVRVSSISVKARKGNILIPAQFPTPTKLAPTPVSLPTTNGRIFSSLHPSKAPGIGWERGCVAHSEDNLGDIEQETIHPKSAEA